jgi:hypothetical protein
MEPSTLGWKPMVVSWLQELHKRVSPQKFGEKNADYKIRLEETFNLLTCAGETKDNTKEKDNTSGGNAASLAAAEIINIQRSHSQPVLQRPAAIQTAPGVPNDGEAAQKLLKYFFQTKFMKMVDWLIPPLLKVFFEEFFFLFLFYLKYGSIFRKNVANQCHMKNLAKLLMCFESLNRY